MTESEKSLEIKEKLAHWQGSQRAIRPMDDAIALKKLHAAKLSDEEIEEKLERLSIKGAPASPRVLASYADLHALDRLGEANQGIDLSDNRSAANQRAILQAAEIALLTTRDLAKRATRDINAGKLGEAEEKYRWISALQRTLASLGDVASKHAVRGKGADVSISDSVNAGQCLEDLRTMHRAMEKAGLTDEDHISRHDLHDPARNLSHQAFVDTTYIDLWNKSLQRVRLPGVEKGNGETKEAFYRRLIGTDALDLAVNELDQKGDNFLRQFRAYHQMSEVLVAQANQCIAETITKLLDPNIPISEAREQMRMTLGLLDVVNENIEPILNHLSVNKYQDIRGSLGITSGSHSPNIRGGLFAPLYDLLVKSAELRVMDLHDYAPSELHNRLHEVMEPPRVDEKTQQSRELLRDVHDVHLHLRKWRDLHMQFVRTQIGQSPIDETPTASISGARDALKSATGMRQNAHGHRDPIKAIHEAITGQPFQREPRESLAIPFADAMLVNTARVVAERSRPVQERVKR